MTDNQTTAQVSSTSGPIPTIDELAQGWKALAATLAEVLLGTWPGREVWASETCEGSSGEWSACRGEEATRLAMAFWIAAGAARAGDAEQMTAARVAAIRRADILPAIISTRAAWGVIHDAAVAITAELATGRSYDVGRTRHDLWAIAEEGPACVRSPARRLLAVVDRGPNRALAEWAKNEVASVATAARMVTSGRGVR